MSDLDQLRVDHRRDESSRAKAIASARSPRPPEKKLETVASLKLTPAVVFLAIGLWAVLIFAAIGFGHTMSDLAWWIGGGK